MSNRQIRTEYQVATARQILATFRDIDDARAYVRSTLSAGFLPTVDADTLTITTKAVNR